MSPNPQWSCRGPARWPTARSALPQMSTGGAHIITSIRNLSLSLSLHLNLHLQQNGTRPLGLRCVRRDKHYVPLDGRCSMLWLTRGVGSPLCSARWRVAGECRPGRFSVWSGECPLLAAQFISSRQCHRPATPTSARSRRRKVTSIVRGVLLWCICKKKDKKYEYLIFTMWLCHVLASHFLICLMLLNIDGCKWRVFLRHSLVEGSRFHQPLSVSINLLYLTGFCRFSNPKKGCGTVGEKKSWFSCSWDPTCSVLDRH